MLPLLLALACAPDQPVTVETEGRPSWDGSWSLARSAQLIQDEGAVWVEVGGAVHRLADEAVGAPAVSDDGRRIALAHRGDGGSVAVLDAVTLTDTGVETRRLVSEGAPDRVALTPDGDTVVYVHNATGIAAVWAVPFAGGAPVQLTNVDLERVPGQAPIGFVPPPHDSPLRIDGDRVVWTSPEGTHGVDLP